VWRYTPPTKPAHSPRPLTRARRIVVKVGLALLVEPSSGRLNRAWLETLVEDLLRLRQHSQRLKRKTGQSP
jgi:glutamate 5-kinase